MSGDSEVEVSDNHFTNVGTGMAVGVDMVGLNILDNDFTNTNEEFNFRNQTAAVTFDAELAVAVQSGDFINVLGGQGGDTLYGTSTSDVLDGNQLNTGALDADTLDARAGNDIMVGRGGDDMLVAGAGDDMLFGDAGYDSAVFSGNMADYTITVLSGGVIQFVDTRPGSPDGTDQLSGIERVVFADEDYTLNPDGSLTLINYPPVAVDDVNSAVEDGPVVNGSVATNDSDPDPGETATLMWSLNAPVAGLTLQSNGSYSFDPAHAAYQSLAVGATANVVATYTVTDEHGATDTGTLTVTVTGTNDLPVVTGAVTASVDEGDAPIIDRSACHCERSGRGRRPGCDPGRSVAGGRELRRRLGADDRLQHLRYRLSGRSAGLDRRVAGLAGQPDRRCQRQPDAPAGERSELERLRRSLFAGLCPLRGGGCRGG